MNWSSDFCLRSLTSFRTRLANRNFVSREKNKDQRPKSKAQNVNTTRKILSLAIVSKSSVHKNFPWVFHAKEVRDLAIVFAIVNHKVSSLSNRE